MTNSKVFVVFLFSVFLVCVTGKTNCKNDSSQRCVIVRGIKSFGNFAEKYQEGFNNRIPLRKLRDAINKVNQIIQSYDGSAKNSMISLRNLNGDFEGTYSDCVTPVFDWCSSSKKTFDKFIYYQSSSALAKLSNKLSEGYEQMMQSLSVLRKLISEITEIKNKLGKIKYDLKKDFSPNGHYGSLMHRRAKRSVVLGLLNYGFRVSRAFTTLFFGNTLRWPANIDDETIRKLEATYNELNTEIIDTLFYAKQAHDELIEDSHNLNALHGLIIGAQDLLELFNSNIKNSIIDALSYVRAKCLEYTNWHENVNI